MKGDYKFFSIYSTSINSLSTAVASGLCRPLRSPYTYIRGRDQSYAKFPCSKCCSMLDNHEEGVRRALRRPREKEGVYLVIDLKVASDRNRAINAAVSQIEKQFGKGSIMRMGDEGLRKVASISTGALALDLALGVGGVPRGRVIEIYGPESSGKTTLALHIIAEAQKAGGLAALVPRAEIEGEMGDSHVGLQARLMSQALRKLSGSLSRSGTTAIFINQLREKIGVMFGSPETTPGGRALKFYASVRLDIRRIGALKIGNDAVGNQ